MKTITILGAGRSSGELIKYLLKYASTNDSRVVVGDVSMQAARERIADHPTGTAITFDIRDEKNSSAAIETSDVVVSLLPAHFHPLVASHCLHHKKHLVTASYVSDEMKAFDKPCRDKSLVFLNECGLDPGIDHMSAMQVIDKLKATGHHLTSFFSFTGGLIAPETERDNPWRYKFTWNARNVVMAGQSTAKYLSEGQYKFIPYQQLFLRTTPVTVPGLGELEGYANRDSLKYIDAYGLSDIGTMLRGTLRFKGFCSAWNVLAQLGCCDDSYELPGIASMTHREFLSCFVNGTVGSVEDQLMKQFSLASNSEEMKRLRWSGLFSEDKIGISSGTPAAALEHILNKRWMMKPVDKDLVVMWHRFGAVKDGKSSVIEAHMVVKGTDAVGTAMAKTVGVPLGIATKLLLEGKIKSRGVVIPTTKEFYDPLLSELSTLGIKLEERHISG